MKNKVMINASIFAPLDQVWSSYTEPEHITQWNFASDDWHCPSATNDLRTGGKYSARMEAKDGSFGFDLNATYEEVVNHKRIAMVLEDGRQAVTEFNEVGNRTEVTTHFDPEKENPEEMQRSGWQSILDNFKRYVEKK